MSVDGGLEWKSCDSSVKRESDRVDWGYRRGRVAPEEVGRVASPFCDPTVQRDIEGVGRQSGVFRTPWGRS